MNLHQGYDIASFFSVIGLCYLLAKQFSVADREEKKPLGAEQIKRYESGLPKHSKDWSKEEREKYPDLYQRLLRVETGVSDQTKPSRLVEFQRLSTEGKPIDFCYFDGEHWSSMDLHNTEDVSAVRSLCSQPGDAYSDASGKEHIREVLVSSGLTEHSTKALLSALSPHALYSVRRVTAEKSAYIGLVKVNAPNTYPKAPYEILVTKLDA